MRYIEAHDECNLKIEIEGWPEVVIFPAGGTCQLAELAEGCRFLD